MSAPLPSDYRSLAAAAAQAARVGGAVLLDQARGCRDLAVDEKARNDFVTAADRASEEAILAWLRGRFPGYGILAEESAAEHRFDGPVWIVDPLDGTTNFIHGFPMWCVSVALAVDGVPVAGAVFDPVHDEMFSASRGDGALLQGQPIRVAGRMGLGGCLLATGFPFKIQERLTEYLRSFEAFARATAGIRRAGSAAIDLCSVAAGRFDGFWEMSLAPWDVAAGGLIIQEAGGVVSDFSGRDTWLRTGHIVAGNPRVHAAMLEVLRRTLA